ncbi:hypothetical protein EV192_1194 [Actinocrispum wychmicini]|uniref:Uncharacterized protein n=1 Tax=Actinocrispum wychmicini TaxID=1213861 RepID=A0A4R2IR31_9PSEU|nr:hypothetical protein EV192_1194 [Actinocrispum wychmicini]
MPEPRRTPRRPSVPSDNVRRCPTRPCLARSDQTLAPFTDVVAATPSCVLWATMTCAVYARSAAPPRFGYDPPSTPSTVSAAASRQRPRLCRQDRQPRTVTRVRRRGGDTKVSRIGFPLAHGFSGVSEPGAVAVPNTRPTWSGRDDMVGTLGDLRRQGRDRAKLGHSRAAQEPQAQVQASLVVWHQLRAIGDHQEPLARRRYYRSVLTQSDSALSVACF